MPASRDRVHIGAQITDRAYSRPLAQAIRELAAAVNDHERALPSLASTVSQLASTQLSLRDIHTALSPSGALPLNPPTAPSRGGSGTVVYGGHKARMALPITSNLDGLLYWETDRTVLYLYRAASGWTYVAGVCRRTLSGTDADDDLPPVTGPPDESSDGGDTGNGVNAAGATGHPGGAYDGSAYRAGLIIGGTANEYPALTAPTSDQATRDANMLELLLRMIWHLNLDGYTAGRQRNPSGVLSTDKLCVVEDGVTRAFDVFTGVYTGTMTVQAIQVSPANLVPDAGLTD